MITIFIIIAIIIFIISIFNFLYATSSQNILNFYLTAISGLFLFITLFTMRDVEIGRYKILKVYEVTNMSTCETDYIIESDQDKKFVLPNNKTKHRLNGNMILVVQQKHCLFGFLGENEISYIIER